MCADHVQRHATAELEETVISLAQNLAATQRRGNEVQQMADAAQQQAGAAQGLTQEIEQLRSSLQVKDMELASVKVRRRVSPCVQCLQRNTFGIPWCHVDNIIPVIAYHWCSTLKANSDKTH